MGFHDDGAEGPAPDVRDAGRRLLDSSLALRRRLVRTLHEGSQQRLITILTSLRLASDGLRDDQPELRGLLMDAADQAKESVDELRELAFVLYPSVLATRGLEAALRGLAVRSALPVTVTTALPERLPDGLAAHAYFVIAEAVAAASRSDGVSVDVDLSLRAGRLVARVQDHARPADTIDDSPAAGFPARITGLSELVDRVTLLGGRLVVSSELHRGRTLMIEIPLPDPDDAVAHPVSAAGT
jgi:signal transduction histidine kinase